MRQLASTLIAAANTADENKTLRRELEEIKYELDKDRQRQIISRLEAKHRDNANEISLLREKINRLKQERGQEKHRADMLEIKVQSLERKAARERYIDDAIQEHLKTETDK